MAKVWVRWLDCEEGRFPDVCARCGAPATCRVEKEFGRVRGVISYQPLTGRTMRASLPMCERHRHHWRNFQRGTLAWLIALVVVLGPGVIVPLVTESMPLLGLGSFALLMIGGILVYSIADNSLQGGGIEVHGMTLTGVHERFVEQYQAQSQEAERKLAMNTAKQWLPESSPLPPAVPLKLSQGVGNEDEDSVPWWSILLPPDPNRDPNRVWLRRIDCKDGAFPDVCARCGAPATCRVAREFGSPLGWKMQASLPMCAQHQDHFTRRRRTTLVALATLTAGFVVLVLGLVVCGVFDWEPGFALAFAFGMGITSLPIAGFALVCHLATAGIQAEEITEEGMRLRGVNAQFGKAYRQQSKAALSDLGEEVRRGWGEQQSQHPAQESDDRVRPGEQGYQDKP